MNGGMRCIKYIALLGPDLLAPMLIGGCRAQNEFGHGGLSIHETFIYS